MYSGTFGAHNVRLLFLRHLSSCYETSRTVPIGLHQHVYIVHACTIRTVNFKEYTAYVSA